MGALAEPDEGDVWPLPGGYRSDLLDLDLARDHLVPERRDDRDEKRKSILTLVGDQYAEMLSVEVLIRVCGGCESSSREYTDAPLTLRRPMVVWSASFAPSRRRARFSRLQHSVGARVDSHGQRPSQVLGVEYVHHLLVEAPGQPRSAQGAQLGSQK